MVRLAVPTIMVPSAIKLLLYRKKTEPATDAKDTSATFKTKNRKAERQNPGEPASLVASSGHRIL